VKGAHLIDVSGTESQVPAGHWQVLSKDIVRSDGRLTLQLCEMAAEGGAEPHAHQDHDQIFFVISGRLRVVDGSGRETFVDSGQGVLITAGTEHGTDNAIDDISKYLVVTYPTGD
jgi:mannose-6-phosphate isomerase-like protein (cupin superfamily)